MEQKPEQEKRNFLTLLTRNYAGSLTHVALSSASAWTIVIGLKGLLGFTVNTGTALADLLGILIVVGVARWIKVKYNVK